MQLSTLKNKFVKPKMYSEVISVTPEIASSLLENHNHDNRGLNKNAIEKYSKIMRSGNWALTPQGLVVDHNTGKLVDGQHRLMAICQTGITVDMYITYVDDPETFKFLDQGRNRDFSDISGTPKKITVVVQQAMRLADIQRKGITYVEAEPYIFGRLGQEVRDLYDNVKPCGHMWGNAVFKSMAVCSIIAGNMPKQEVYDLYNAFLDVNTVGMSSCRKNFLRQVMNRDVISTQTPDKAIVSKAYNLFSRDGDDLQISRYTIASFEKGLATIQRAVRLGKG
tara:strand:+ start:86 stop:925 length:840 start_codon:yes stop_codon:yes gene_type:complete